MDLNGAAGLALLGGETIISIYPWFKILQRFSDARKIPPYGRLIWESLSVPRSMPRLCVALCIRGKIQEAFCSIAVVCSSWSAVNLHTSQRDVLTPLGQWLRSGVNAGNRMVARWGPINSLKPIVNTLNLIGEVCRFSRCLRNFYHIPQGGDAADLPTSFGAFLDGRKPIFFMSVTTSLATVGHQSDPKIWWCGHLNEFMQPYYL